MTLKHQTIKDRCIGDDFDIERPVTGIPAGVTLTKAWLMVKASERDADAAAVISKTITAASVAGTGHITDTGSGDQAGELVFQIQAANTAGLTAKKTYHYGIKVQLSSGVVDTLETGKFVLDAAIVQATA